MYVDQGGKLCTYGVISPALLCNASIIVATRASDFVYLYDPESLPMPSKGEYGVNATDEPGTYGAGADGSENTGFAVKPDWLKTTIVAMLIVLAKNVLFSNDI